MKINCDIAMDLVDIYTSGASSDETQAAVEEHLKTCRSCRDFYSGYKADIGSKKHQKATPNLRFEASGVDEELITRSLSRLSKRLRTRQVITTTCAAIAAVLGLAAVLYDLINEYRRSE